MKDRWIERALICGLFGIALAVRLAAFPHVTHDYTNFLEVWYRYLETHGGFLALRDKFANYNVPYLYLMAAVTYVPLPALYGVKLISVGFDAVLAIFAYRLVRLKYTARWIGGLAAVAVLLLPTVWLNSAMWGQADSIYAACCVGGVYYLMRRRPWLACLLLGTAFAFKLQAVFVFPVVIVLATVRYLPSWTLLAIPGAYVGWALPALLLGHNVRDLAFVYVDQIGLDPRLTANAPSVYQFIRIDDGVSTVRTAGVIFTTGLVLLLTLLVLKSRRPVESHGVLLLALLFAILVPFFLPAMHERYFYVADVLSIVSAFFVPRMIFVPLLVQIASALSYVAFLFKTDTYGVSVDQRVLALLMFVALLLVLREFVREFELSRLFDEPRAIADTNGFGVVAPDAVHRGNGFPSRVVE